MTRPRVPRAVQWIARTLEEAGHETWTVGGAVRDWLFGIPSGDWDLTTRATPDQVRRLFGRTVPLGVEHGTVGVLSREGVLYEVTTFRRDVETTGRHAVVEFAESLDEDLARRDFTVNAVAWHPLEERLHDPYGGTADLESRVLRTVGDAALRFAEDYLRVLRGLRFAGTYGLTIEARTWRALVEAVDHLAILSPERIREEMEKVLAGRTPPSRAIALYGASRALQRLYPELDAVRGVARPSGEWFAHTLRALDLAPAARTDLRWATLFQAVGEPEVVPAADVRDPGPDLPQPATAEGDSPEVDTVAEQRGRRGMLRAAAILERLRSSNARIQDVAGLVRWVARPPASDASDTELRRWLARAGRRNLGPLLRIWLACLRADEARGGGDWNRDDYMRLYRRLRAIARSGDPLAVAEISFSGRDLIGMGYRPGPRFGEVLEHLLDRVLADPALDDPEWLAGEARRWMEARRESVESDGGRR